MRALFLIYGVVAYLLFFAAILYGIGFVGNVWVPKGIDDGQLVSLPLAVTIDVLLLLLFAVQHNIMARPWFKEWWTRFVPRPIERSTYVAVASIILLVLYWQWRPIPEIAWNVENTFVRSTLWAIYFVGWGVVFYSSFVIDHFDLFGLRQVWIYFRGIEPAPPQFSERSIYRWVRHPLMLGFILAFWSAPTMSQGRLLFAAVTTLWILIAIQIEERDLENLLGEPYSEYQRRTPMLVPLLRLPRRGD
jgi:protein-S-isoprenylcysteine O-methyltransferase Ste14